MIGGTDRPRAGWAAGSLLLLLACGSPTVARAPAAEAETKASSAPDRPWPELWSERTEARPNAVLPPELASLLEACDSIDAGLVRVAERLAERDARGQPPLQSEELMFELRAAGVPQTWPTVWAVSGPPDARAAAGKGVESDLRNRLPEWLAGLPTQGQRRCGLAQRSDAEGGLHAMAVTLDAVAELEPVARQMRQSQWLEVEAKMLVPSEGGQLVVLGPRGAPFKVPTSFGGGALRAKVNLDAPGSWLLQVLATVDGGPRPVLEATVYVDELPPSEFHSLPTPGEHEVAIDTAAASAQDLRALLNAARKSERLPALVPHPSLDRLALQHAQAMQARGRVAHDVGNGDPARRLESGGVNAEVVGENVAIGASLVAAHRALWASPSHRGNMLHSRFTDVGVGVVQDEAGKVWVCELFASF